MNNFENFGLSAPLMRALATEGYDRPTAIQQLAIPPVLEGRDLMGCAQTGTGKTAAFALPTLQRLSEKKEYAGKANRAIRGLVLAPTRELSAQIEQSFRDYGKYLQIRVAVVHGGVSQTPQVRALERGVDILVATPGRLLDLMNQRFVDISKIEVLVIDEADQMFDMGFLRDLKRIVTRVPVERQTLMFSATMPEPIRDLAKQWLNDPKYIRVAKVSSASALVDQSVFHVSAKNKAKLLASYVQNAGVTRSIVFTRTKHGADDLVKVLLKSGIDAIAIHGNKSQGARTRNLERFKSNKPPILVATDIAARGIDVEGVSHVINYNLPEVPEIYVHRIGRTGRAEATGVAVSFCSPEELSNLHAVERLLNTTIEVNPGFAEFTQSAHTAGEPMREGRSASTGRTRSTGRGKRVSSPKAGSSKPAARTSSALAISAPTKKPKRVRKPSCFR